MDEKVSSNIVGLLCHHSYQVDEDIFVSLWDQDRTSAMHLSLMSNNPKLLLNDVIMSVKQVLYIMHPEVICLSLKMSQNEVAQVVDSTMLEIILQKGHTPTILATPIYPLFCGYLRSPPAHSTLDQFLNCQLLARLLDCSVDELPEQLGFNSPQDRVQKAVTQLYEADFMVEAGSLLHSTKNVPRPPILSNVNTALSSLRNMFQ